MIPGIFIGKLIDAVSLQASPCLSGIFLGAASIAFPVVSFALLALRHDTKRMIERSGITVELIEEEIDQDV